MVIFEQNFLRRLAAVVLAMAVSGGTAWARGKRQPAQPAKPAADSPKRFAPGDREKLPAPPSSVNNVPAEAKEAAAQKATQIADQQQIGEEEAKFFETVRNHVSVKEWSPNQVMDKKDGSTLLHIAVRRGYATVVKYLMEQGADPKIYDMVGHTPLSLARDQNRQDLVVLLVRPPAAAPAR